MAGRPNTSSKKSTTEKVKLTCNCCGKEKINTDFYMGKSIICKATNRLSVCKDCVGNVYDKYYSKYNDDKLSLYYMCRALGICFSLSIYNGAIQDLSNGKNTPTWKMYMQKLNSLGTKNGVGDDFDSSDEINISKELEIISEKTGVNKELINKWGKSYTDDEILWLEKTYNEWINKYKSDTMSEQKTFKLLTIKELQIMKAIESGSNTDKLEETYLKLMSAGNVTPRDANTSMEDENTKGLGVWVKDIERYRPAEYFEDKKLYKDYDSLVEYLNRFVFRPLKNFLLKTKEYDKEFTIEDEFKVNDK